MPIPYNPENYTRTRHPKCSVAFLTDTEIIVDSEQLISVETYKTLSEPAGSFRILLKPNALVRDVNSQYVPAGSISPQGSTVDPKIPDTVTGWLTHLRPMSLVQIAFTEKQFPDNVSFTVPSKDPTNTTILNQLQKKQGWSSPEMTTWLQGMEITMLGVIDSVSIVKQMVGGGPQRYIQVLGRDMARAFMDDTHYVFPFPFNDNSSTSQSSQSSDGQKRGLAFYLNGTPDQQRKAVGRYFFDSGTDNTGKSVPPWRQAYLTGNVGQIIQAIYDNASGLNLSLANGTNLRDYLPAPLVPDDIKDIPFIGAKLMMSSGSVWSLFQEVIPSPFGEMFVDTVGNEARLIIRRPPWGRVFYEQEDQINRLAATYVPGRTDGNVPLGATLSPSTNPVGDYLRKKRALWNVDEVVNTPCRVIDANYHDIFDEDIVEMNLGKSDREVINLYFTKASANWAGDETSPVLSAALVTPLLDILSIGRYGLRLLQRENSWWNPRSAVKNDGTTAEAPDKNILAELLLDNLRLYFWFRDNDNMLSGQLTIRGRPEVRIGDYIRMPGEGLMFYVESVSNRWVFGQPFITTITVTRGQLEKPLTAAVGEGETGSKRTIINYEYGSAADKLVPSK